MTSLIVRPALDSPDRPAVCQRDGCPAPGEHDTSAGYVRGCPSRAALDDRRRYVKRLAAGLSDRRRPAWPTRRRLQSLAAAGWSWPALGERSGMHWRALSIIAHPTRRRFVQASTADTIAGLYAQLRTMPGPEQRAATWAEKRGWPGPDEWGPGEIDDPAVDPRRADPAVPLEPDRSVEFRIERVVHARARLEDLSNAEQDVAVNRLFRTRTSVEIAVFLGADRALVERILGRTAGRRRELAAS